MISTQQDWPHGLFSTDHLPPFYGHVYARSMLTPPSLYGANTITASFGDPSSWVDDHAPKIKPPAGTTAQQRVQTLIDTYGGADLSQYAGGPPSQQLLDIARELQYYVNGNSWVYCTLMNYLNGTPSEDDLGWWSKRFTAHCMEDECGDHSFGDQYKAALEILTKQGAPKSFVEWIDKKSAPLLAKKIPIYKKDAEQNLDKAWRAAGKSINPFDPSSPLFYVAIGLGALAVFSILRR